MAMYEATDTNTSSIGKMLSGFVSNFQDAKRRKLAEEMQRLQMEQQKAQMEQQRKEGIEADQRRDAMIKLFSQGNQFGQAKQDNQRNMALQDVQGMPGIPFAVTPEQKAMLPNNDADLTQQNQAFMAALSQAQGQLAAGQSKMNAFTPSTMSGLEGLGTIASGGNFIPPQVEAASVKAAAQEKKQKEDLAFKEKKQAQDESFRRDKLKETINSTEGIASRSEANKNKRTKMMAEAVLGRQLDIKNVEQQFKVADAIYDEASAQVAAIRKEIAQAKGDSRPAAEISELRAELVDAEAVLTKANSELRESADFAAKQAQGASEKKGSPKQKTSAANDAEGDNANRDWEDQEVWWTSMSKEEQAAFKSSATGKVDPEKVRQAWKKKKTAK